MVWLIRYRDKSYCSPLTLTYSLCNRGNPENVPVGIVTRLLELRSLQREGVGSRDSYRGAWGYSQSNKVSEW